LREVRISKRNQTVGAEAIGRNEGSDNAPTLAHVDLRLRELHRRRADRPAESRYWSPSLSLGVPDTNTQNEYRCYADRNQ